MINGIVRRTYTECATKPGLNLYRGGILCRHCHSLAGCRHRSHSCRQAVACNRLPRNIGGNPQMVNPGCVKFHRTVEHQLRFPGIETCNGVTHRGYRGEHPVGARIENLCTLDVGNIRRTAEINAHA